MNSQYILCAFPNENLSYIGVRGKKGYHLSMNFQKVNYTPENFM